MNNFEKIISILKEKINIKTDKELSEKLGMKTNTFGERKKTNSIPHNEILNLCISENLNLNEIYTENTIINNNINYKEKIIENLEKLNDKELKYFYHWTSGEIAKKDL